MSIEAIDGGSFRDPSGQVHHVDGRILRTVMPCAVEDFEFVRSTGLTDRLVKDGDLIAESIVDKDALGAVACGAHCVLEHPRLPFISYPYEWPFSALKAAALHHLDVHLTALEYGVTLSDASAYNVQFRGVRPVFIDSLSFRRYREGEFWIGHRQFCEQFLNPLLIRAEVGLPHNSWYRGELEGISAETLCRVLPALRKLTPRILMHVVLQARFQSRRGNQEQAERVVKKRHLPRAAFVRLLAGLRKWIARLEPRDRRATVWQEYADDNSYSREETQRKHEFILKFAKAHPGATLWDLGCNTGAYSQTALAGGVSSVIGFDFDQGALDLAFSRAQEKNLNLLPLFLDVANPPPCQGWAQSERQGFAQRATADAVMALALIHHLAIGRNVPLPAIVDWLIRLAPAGIIEFVPKTDPMVRRLLQLRQDDFEQYSEESCYRSIERHAEVVRSETVSPGGRKLIWYKRGEAEL